uniref:Uncharacterized protein n=1 Tax=Gasterosteus aculeatus aculeatus TaxID=481459 RepID=A0AAQ4P733_GASAC
ARRRRRVESEVFEDLSRLLPLQPAVQAHLDKPSVIRLTLSYIRMHTDAEASEETDLYLRILEGFLIVLSSEGDMIYLSDNVSKYMGLTQNELIGHNIFEFTHPCDHDEIRNNLQEVWSGAKRDFVVRIKSAPTYRGRSASLKSATWKVGEKQPNVAARRAPDHSHWALFDRAPSVHSMDMRFTHCDQRITLLLGYRTEELLGRSIYDLCHTLDTCRYLILHLSLSLSLSLSYRMLVSGGGYVWVETHSAVIPSVRPCKSRPGAHHVIKGIPCLCTQVYIRLQTSDHLHYPLLIHLIKCIHSYMSTVEWRSRPCSSLWTRWCTFELKLKSEEQSAKPASPAKPQQSSLPPYVNYYHLQPLLNTKHLHSKQLSVCFYQAMMSPFSIRVKL